MTLYMNKGGGWGKNYPRVGQNLPQGGVKFTYKEDPYKKIPLEERKKEESFVRFSESEEKIRNLLKPYDVDKPILRMALKKTPEIIEKALRAMDQFCHKNSIQDKLPIINKAIYGEWEPNITQEDVIIENKKYADTIKCFDGKVSKSGWKFDIYSKYIEFSYASQCKLFSYDDREFIEKTQKIIKDHFN